MAYHHCIFQVSEIFSLLIAKLIYVTISYAYFVPRFSLVYVHTLAIQP